MHRVATGLALLLADGTISAGHVPPTSTTCINRIVKGVDTKESLPLLFAVYFLKIFRLGFRMTVGLGLDGFGLLGLLDAMLLRKNITRIRINEARNFILTISEK